MSQFHLLGTSCLRHWVQDSETKLGLREGVLGMTVHGGPGRRDWNSSTCHLFAPLTPGTGNIQSTRQTWPQYLVPVTEEITA